MSKHRLFVVVSIVSVLLSIGAFLALSLNYGIDFKGGILVEVRTQGPADMADLRGRLNGLGLGEVSLQEFGEPEEVLIRIEDQGGEEHNQAAVSTLQGALGPTVEYRRIETVGPTVGAELKEAATWAVLASLGAILLYLWFRFEWQFGVGAIVATAHDVVLTVGLFAVLGMEFNLSTVAALLTLAGYSINDTVVVYDRVRENMRKYKRMEMAQLLNRSVNDTLSRTILTGVTTLLALIALYSFGGEVLRGFCFALIWGIVVGTFSSIFVAAPLLLYMKPRRSAPEGEAEGASVEARKG